MARKAKLFANLQVGRADVRPDLPSHVSGVRQGNKPGNIEHEPGIVQEEDRRFARGTARRSTGISSRARNPIDPRMPNLSPA